MSADNLVIAGKSFASRLFMGTGGYPNQQALLDSLEAGQPITQAQIDALTAGVQQADGGLGTLVSTVVPVVTPPAP